MTKALNLSIAKHLVFGIEPAKFHEADSETERHRGVIGPLAGPETERAASDHFGSRSEAASRSKLNGCSHGIAARQSEEAPSKSFRSIHVGNSLELLNIICDGAPQLGRSLKNAVRVQSD